MFLRVNEKTVVSKVAPADVEKLWWDANPEVSNPLSTHLVVEGGSVDVTDYMSDEAFVEVPNTTTYCKKYNTSTNQWEAVTTKKCYPITISGNCYSNKNVVGCPADEHVVVDISFGGGYTQDIIENSFHVTGCSWRWITGGNTGGTIRLENPTSNILISFNPTGGAEPE